MGKKLGRSARAEQLSGCGAETAAFSAEASVSECSSTQASRQGIDWWPDGEAAKRDSQTPSAVRRPDVRTEYRSISGCATVVVPQHAAETLVARDLAGSAGHFIARFDQPVVQPLMVSLLVIEVRNTLPPNTKSAKCTIPGTRSSADEFMFTECSTNSVGIFVGVGCLGRRTGLVSRCRHGCLIERIVPS